MSSAIFATALVPYGPHGDGADATCEAAPPRRGAAGRRRLRREGFARLARDRLGPVPTGRHDRREEGALLRPRVGRRAAGGHGPRARRVVAELAREHPADGTGAARDRPGPAWAWRVRDA